MTPSLRANGAPSPFALDTADDTDLPPPIPFDPAVAEAIAQRAPSPRWETLPGELAAGGGADMFDLPAGTPAWLAVATRLIRPICVGALLAIPTLGAATVGVVALFSGAGASRMVAASTAFLAGIPVDVVVLIGVLAGGYTRAKSAEKLAARGAPVR